jgi:hypothetical protein
VINWARLAEERRVEYSKASLVCLNKPGMKVYSAGGVSYRGLGSTSGIVIALVVAVSGGSALVLKGV